MFRKIKIPKGPHIAILNKGELISFDMLNYIVSKQIALYSQLGISSGDQIGLFIRDPFHFLISYLSLWNLGATPILLDSQINTANIANNLEIAEASYLLSDYDSDRFDDFDKVESGFGLSLYVNKKQSASLLKDRYGEDNQGFIILFTSGSQAAPKAVTLKKESILNNIRKVIDYLGLTQEDITLATLPLSYSYAMSQVLAHLIVGGRVVFENHCYLVENIIHLIDKHKISNYAATPYFFQALLPSLKQDTKQAQSFTSIKFFMNAGGYLTPSTIQKLLQELPHITFYNNYGQTEASPRLTYAKFFSNSSSFIGVGRPLPGVEIKVELEDKLSEVGEILYRSEDIMLGYYGTFDDTLTQQWFRTGDIGSLVNGELYIKGRKDSMIKVNGRKVYINRTEDIIYEFDGVKHVSLSKMQHGMYGEYLIAVITPKNNDISTDKLKKSIWKFMRETLSPSERPQKILINNDVKINSNGKVIKELKGAIVRELHENG